jgi:hypothetical protein
MRTFMNPHRTISILQRLPVILAVTAASYGLPPQAQAPHSSKAVRGGRSGAVAAATHRLGVH